MKQKFEELVFKKFMKDNLIGAVFVEESPRGVKIKDYQKGKILKSLNLEVSEIKMKKVNKNCDKCGRELE